MTKVDYKQFTPEAKKQIKGEGFFEALISTCTIPHKAVAPKDLGIDYFCEWAPEDRPTGILFGAQVKSSSEDKGKPKQVGWVKGEDDTELLRYDIPNEYLRIGKSTLRYWEKLGIPVYLFAIIESKSESDGKKNLTCYYKRYTPHLHKKDKNFRALKAFYKVSESVEFQTYKYPERKLKGFARDLYIDYLRCCYIKGTMPYVNPTEFGVGGYDHFKEGTYITEFLLNDYKEEILTTFLRTKAQLEHAGLIEKP